MAVKNSVCRSMLAVLPPAVNPEVMIECINEETPDKIDELKEIVGNQYIVL